MRQRASELLRLVQRGQTLQITDRGRPVAQLSPIADGGPLDRLRAAGDVSSATADLADLPAPLDLAADQDAPSSVLARLRNNER